MESQRNARAHLHSQRPSLVLTTARPRFQSLVQLHSFCFSHIPGQLAVRGSLSTFVNYQHFNFAPPSLVFLRAIHFIRHVIGKREGRTKSKTPRCSRAVRTINTAGRTLPTSPNETAMQSPYRQAMATLRTSARRSSTSSRASSDRSSYLSVASSQARVVNSIIFRQPSILGMEEERSKYGNDLDILEPRPIVYWGGVEERMGRW